MKIISRLFSIVLLVCALGFTPSFAQTDRAQNFQTSFPFYAGKTLMPPGAYFVRMSTSDATILTVQSKDGHHTAIVNFIPSDAEKAHTDTVVTFRRYGTTDFLHRIWLSGQRFGMVILPTKMETKMNDHEAPQEHSVPAS